MCVVIVPWIEGTDGTEKNNTWTNKSKNFKRWLVTLAYEIIEMSEKTKEVIEKGKASEEVIEIGVYS